MINLSVTACSFNVRRSNSRADVVFNLNSKIDYFDKENDENSNKFINEIFIDFFNNFNDYVDDENDHRLFSCKYIKSKELDNCKYILAEINSGIYGSSSEIVDKDTKMTIKTISPDQAPVKKFYFVIVLPKDNKNVSVQKGMFFFQNYGQYGIKTVTSEYLKRFINDKYQLTLKTGNIAPSIFAEKVLEKNRINKIILTKNNKSIDDSDDQFLGYGTETRILSRIKLSNDFLNKIKNYVTKRSCLFEYDDIDYDLLKVEVELGGRKRTLNLNNIENLSIIEPLNNDLLMPDGYLREDETFDAIITIAEEYLEKMVLTITGD